jgi:LuxR family maltose regulon positive regulatory protein
VNRLRAERSLRLATVVAPAGYGKTTLLVQWAARDERPFVWLSIDEHDNDPVILLRHLAAALERVEPLDASVADGLAGESIWRVAAPRVTNAFAARRQPFVAVLDDADLLHKRDSADIVVALAENVPEGSMLVLTGRVAPRVGLARLRAGRRLLELGPGELALSRREAQLLLRGAGVELEPAAVAELCDRTEGWPGGLYLIARALAETPGSHGSEALAASDRYVADYFESEHLSGLTPERLAFLLRTSVLDRLCGPLCDAVTECAGSTAELHAIERANLFLVPLDRQRAWYRYHRLFRETLRRELEQSDPELIPVLHRRAADWFEAHGELEAALDHVQACGDAERAARLLTAVALPAYSAGRAAAVEGWLDRFAADAELERYPAAAALGAWIHALHGRAAEAGVWLDAANARRGGRSAAAVKALLHVAMCAGTVDELAESVEAAAAALRAESPWRGMAHLLQGSVAGMRGDAESADASFAAAGAAEHADAAGTCIVALAARSLAAASADDHAAAERLALEARALLVDGPVAEYPTSAIAHAAAARVLLRRGRWDDARREIGQAEPLAKHLTEALPWLAGETRLALAAAYLALRDREGARAQLAVLDEIVAGHPCLDVFNGRMADLRRELDQLPEIRDGRSSGLTAAELRLLPLLATHLSFREIGEHLYVSRNTIKTQAISAYRKLGVSSRSAAIQRACELGLVEDAAATQTGFTRQG